VGPSVSIATKVYENQLRPAHAVYQGTASAVPQEAVNYPGFSPCRIEKAIEVLTAQIKQ
jgi:hypothetical protein